VAEIKLTATGENELYKLLKTQAAGFENARFSVKDLQPAWDRGDIDWSTTRLAGSAEEIVDSKQVRKTSLRKLRPHPTGREEQAFICTTCG